MAYGVKRGVRTPGEYRFSDIFGLALAGSAGIIAALVMDYQQSGEASALYTINEWVVNVGSLLEITDIPLWMVVLGLLGVGAGSVFYFQPITRQGAFAQGFGLLAVVMTAVPTDLKGGIEAVSDRDLPGLEANLARQAALPGGIVNAVHSPGEAQIVQVQARRAASKYDLHLKIEFSEGIPDDIDTLIRTGALRGRLHNEDTDETWNLFRSAGGTISRRGDTLVIHAGVPARADTARLWVRIECREYGIKVESATATLEQPLEWTITMVPSAMPLFMQRFGRSYWF